jgi:hypothetical protein
MIMNDRVPEVRRSGVDYIYRLAQANRLVRWLKSGGDEAEYSSDARTLTATRSSPSLGTSRQLRKINLRSSIRTRMDAARLDEGPEMILNERVSP